MTSSAACHRMHPPRGCTSNTFLRHFHANYLKRHLFFLSLCWSPVRTKVLGSRRVLKTLRGIWLWVTRSGHGWLKAKRFLWEQAWTEKHWKCCYVAEDHQSPIPVWVFRVSAAVVGSHRHTENTRPPDLIQNNVQAVLGFCIEEAHLPAHLPGTPSPPRSPCAPTPRECPAGAASPGSPGCAPPCGHNPPPRGLTAELHKRQLKLNIHGYKS